MKILIGTPIHQIKDYAMERWLENVSKLRLQSPADLLIVDNSPTTKYMEVVKRYCAKYGIKNYKIKYLKRSPGQSYQNMYERVARSREIIRKYILSKDYGAWFSWECDQLIPENGLSALIKMMESGDFTVASHSTWLRQNPNAILDELFGTTLIKREVLKRHSFILEFGTDPDMPATWEPSEKWFRKQVLRDGGSTIEADGVLKPIYHLNE